MTLPLTGEWVQSTGFGANGITRTPDHKALMVVHSTSGLLYRVDRVPGAATVVDIDAGAEEDSSLSQGDGLLLCGRILYVVRNRLDKVAVVRLNPRGTEGTKQEPITSDNFDTPTTVARFGNRLYVPNARFESAPEPTPTTPYTVTQVPAR